MLYVEIISNIEHHRVGIKPTCLEQAYYWLEYADPL